MKPEEAQISNLLSQYKTFVFDLDNTLIEEVDYLFPAYKSIAVHIAMKTGENSDELYQFLIDSFLRKGRKNLFNKLITRFNLSEEFLAISLKILRTNKFEKPLKLKKPFYHILELLVNANKHIGILTNGNITQQKNKIKHIFWKSNIKENVTIVYANSIKPKPAPDSLNYILSKISISISNADCLFIGDSIVDFECADAVGTDFIYVDEFIEKYFAGLL